MTAAVVGAAVGGAAVVGAAVGGAGVVGAGPATDAAGVVAAGPATRAAGVVAALTGPRAALTAGIALLVLAAWGLMLIGWRRRRDRWSALPPPPPAPVAHDAPLLEPMTGLYLGTTASGDWLDRVPAHGLADRCAGRLLLLDQGLVVERTGHEPFLVAGEAVAAVRLDTAQAGKVMGEDGVLVITWRLGDQRLDTGFRGRSAEEHRRWVRAVEILLGEADLDAPAYVPAPVADPPGADPSRLDPRADPRPAPRPAPRADLGDSDVSEAAEGSTTPRSAGNGPAGNGPAGDGPAGDGPAGDGGPPAADPLTAPLPALVASPPPEPVRRPAVPLVGRAAPPALLVLEDGRTFHGRAYGAFGETFGEAVFNTGMTGYQETLTDPSYHRQVVVMTAPHVGNTGVNDDDPESRRVWVAGYVVREPARRPSNHRSERSLEAELAAYGVVGVSGVDTRALTRHLRERGAMRVGVSSQETDPEALLARVRQSPVMTGLDLAREVSTREPYVVPAAGQPRFRVAAIDLGIKASTPRRLSEAGCEVHVLPATTSGADVLALEPDGVFFSNGPGDPAAADYAVATMRHVLGRVPVFGICFGNQILGRALGLGTYKLGYGHRGVNQPVQDRHGRVHITSHNHGFAVDAPLDRAVDTAHGRVQVSHVDLNDDVVEGLECLDVPAFSVQYHPEAAPGPHDATGLFRRFAELMAAGA